MVAPAALLLVGGFRRRYPGGGPFLFGDSSVRFVREGINAATYRALSTAAGREVGAGQG